FKNDRLGWPAAMLPSVPRFSSCTVNTRPADALDCGDAAGPSARSSTGGHHWLFDQSPEGSPQGLIWMWGPWASTSVRYGWSIDRTGQVWRGATRASFREP